LETDSLAIGEKVWAPKDLRFPVERNRRRERGRKGGGRGGNRGGLRVGWRKTKNFALLQFLGKLHEKGAEIWLEKVSGHVAYKERSRGWRKKWCPSEGSEMLFEGRPLKVEC